MKPDDLKYTQEHEWVKIENGEATVGITDYAQSELGDIVFIEFPSIGDRVNQNDVSGTIEAVKTVADIFAPLSGEIIKINSNLESNPEYINTDPYEKGWLIKIKIKQPSNDNPLLDSKEYSKIIS